MKLHDNTGVSYKCALDSALHDLQTRYGITRADARKLFAEAIVRNCVWDEIISMCDWQMGKDVQK